MKNKDHAIFFLSFIKTFRIWVKEGIAKRVVDLNHQTNLGNLKRVIGG